MKYIKTNINQKTSYEQYLNFTSNKTVMLNCTKCYLTVFRIHSIKCWINAYQDKISIKKSLKSHLNAVFSLMDAVSRQSE